jgi:NAD(P)H dehydrogenase (quinone)
MSNIAVLYHSGYGHTKKVAEAVAEGAKADLVAIDAEGNVSEADWTKLDNAAAIIMGSPTYMGTVSWQFKKFADASSARWFGGKWKNKIAAGFTNSGSASGDKLSTLVYLMILSMQHGMIWVGQTEGGPQLKGTDMPKATDINRIGSFSGLMTQSNNDTPDVTPPSGDIETAKLFGKRIAEITGKFKA